MPLIPQQDFLSSSGETPELALDRLRTKLENYPPTRVVSISITKATLVYSIIAVIETI